MKMNFNAVILGISSRESKNGQVYYYLNVCSDSGDSFSFPVVEDIVKNLASLKFKNCNFTADYSRFEFNSSVSYRFRIVDFKAL